MIGVNHVDYIYSRSYKVRMLKRKKRIQAAEQTMGNSEGAIDLSDVHSTRVEKDQSWNSSNVELEEPNLTGGQTEEAELAIEADAPSPTPQEQYMDDARKYNNNCSTDFYTLHMINLCDHCFILFFLVCLLSKMITMQCQYITHIINREEHPQQFAER